MKIRYVNLALWLAAGITFWWTHPTPETQVGAFGFTVPPIPSEWVMIPGEGDMVPICLFGFLGLSILYYWIAGRNGRAYSLIWTSIHAFLVLFSLNLIVDPVRTDWGLRVIQVLADEGTSPDQLLGLQNAIGFIGVFISAAMVFIAVRVKIATTEDDYASSLSPKDHGSMHSDQEMENARRQAATSHRTSGYTSIDGGSGQ